VQQGPSQAINVKEQVQAFADRRQQHVEACKVRKRTDSAPTATTYRNGEPANTGTPVRETKKMVITGANDAKKNLSPARPVSPHIHTPKKSSKKSRPEGNVRKKKCKCTSYKNTK